MPPVEFDLELRVALLIVVPLVNFELVDLEPLSQLLLLVLRPLHVVSQELMAQCHHLIPRQAYPLLLYSLTGLVVVELADHQVVEASFDEQRVALFFFHVSEERLHVGVVLELMARIVKLNSFAMHVGLEDAPRHHRS